MLAVTYPHIEIEPDGEPVIAGSGTKVIMVAMDRIAHHWDAHEIQRQRTHLTLGQIHSALAFYYDHEAEMNKRIEDRMQQERDVLSKTSISRVRATLQAAKVSS